MKPITIICTIAIIIALAVPAVAQDRQEILVTGSPRHSEWFWGVGNMICFEFFLNRGTEDEILLYLFVNKDSAIDRTLHRATVRSARVSVRGTLINFERTNSPGKTGIALVPTRVRLIKEH